MSIPRVARLLCPVDIDFSDMSVVATRIAMRFAQITQAEIVFSHVVASPADFQDVLSATFEKIEGQTSRPDDRSAREYLDPGNPISSQRGAGALDIYKKQLERAQVELQSNIDQIGAEFPDVKYSIELRFGVVSDQILEAAEAHGVDVICMATRRGSTIARGILGSVTDNVVKRSGSPMLLIRPSGKERKRFGEFGEWPSAIVVPLDGSRLAETAIPFSVAIGQCQGADSARTWRISGRTSSICGRGQRITLLAG